MKMSKRLFTNLLRSEKSPNDFKTKACELFLDKEVQIWLQAFNPLTNGVRGPAFHQLYTATELWGDEIDNCFFQK